MPDPNNLRDILAYWLRLRRVEKGWSQERLALECDLDRTYVSAVERLRWNVSLSNLDRFAQALGVLPWTLLVPPQALSPQTDQTTHHECDRPSAGPMDEPPLILPQTYQTHDEYGDPNTGPMDEPPLILPQTHQTHDEYGDPGTAPMDEPLLIPPQTHQTHDECGSPRTGPMDEQTPADPT